MNSLVEESFIGNFNDPRFEERVREEVYERSGLAIFNGMYERGQLKVLSHMLGGQVRKFNLTDDDGIGELVTDPSKPVDRDAVDTELNPHTDGSRVTSPAHLLTLYCENPAEIGGESFYLRGADMHKYIQKTNPKLLDALYQPWYFGTPDDGHEAPVFATDDDGLTTVRFRRDCFDHYTEGSKDKGLGFDVGFEIDEALKEMSANGLIRHIMLPRGWGVAVNNYSVLHGRTAISSEGRQIRKLVRANVDVSASLRSYLGFRVTD